jgi:hypothetical protein
MKTLYLRGSKAIKEAVLSYFAPMKGVKKDYCTKARRS